MNKITKWNIPAKKVHFLLVFAVVGEYTEIAD